MRIAQIAPIYERVPPVSYGGTERIVSYLTEELVRQGHDVTLFASGDSITSARLVPTAEHSLRLDPTVVDPMAWHIAMLDLVRQRAAEFDVLHFHCDYLHFPVSRMAGWPTITTLHGRLDIPDLQPLYDAFSDMPVVSISDDQRTPLPQANWLGTVHHGLPRDLYGSRPGDGGYLAFVGRFSPEKRADRAIEIACAAGWPVRLAAKVEKVDEPYFEREIRPLLDRPGVEFVGEIGEAQKNEFMGRAAALLFPIDWCEPFGLVMIEAMACGTPVIAWACGSVPEVITPGISGSIVNSIDEAIDAVRALPAIDRGGCREEFERRFTVERMTADYVALYERVARQSAPTGATTAGVHTR